jgi:hypothetical protein
LYFLDAHRTELVNALSIMGQNNMLNALADMDQAHKEIYFKGLK